MDENFYPDRWTKRLLRDHERRHAYDGETNSAFCAWQDRFRGDLRSALGLPIIKRAGVPSFSPEHLETISEEGYERQEWQLHTEQGFHLPVSMLIPNDREPPYPVTVALHGHGEGGRSITIGRPKTKEQQQQVQEENRDIAVQAVKRGYAAIAPTMRGLGELANKSDKELGYRTCHTLQLHAQMFNRSLAGDRVWDVTRVLDFVEYQDDLDEGQVILTGHSGGGAITLFTAAIDKRVDVVAVSSYFCTFEDSIAALDHCECNYVPGVLRLGEQADIAGLIAPRPFVAVNGVADEIFPIDGVRRAFKRLETIYEAANASEKCVLNVGDGDHKYYPDGIWPFVGENI